MYMWDPTTSRTMAREYAYRDSIPRAVANIDCNTRSAQVGGNADIKGEVTSHHVNSIRPRKSFYFKLLHLLLTSHHYDIRRGILHGHIILYRGGRETVHLPQGIFHQVTLIHELVRPPVVPLGVHAKRVEHLLEAALAPRALDREVGELGRRVAADERPEDALRDGGRPRVGVPVAQAEEQREELLVGERGEDLIDGFEAAEAAGFRGGGDD